MKTLTEFTANNETFTIYYCPEQSEKKPFFDEISEIVNRNADDFITWDEFVNPNHPGGIEKDFFENYYQENEDLLVAVTENEEVAGFASFDISSTRSDVPVDDDVFGYLSLIIVDANYRGNGIGKQLNKSVFSVLQQDSPAENVYLSTWEGNRRQLHIYEEYGCEIVARKEGHRVNGEDTVYIGTEINSLPSI